MEVKLPNGSVIDTKNITILRYKNELYLPIEELMVIYNIPSSKTMYYHLKNMDVRTIVFDRKNLYQKEEAIIGLNKKLKVDFIWK